MNGEPMTEAWLDQAMELADNLQEAAAERAHEMSGLNELRALVKARAELRAHLALALLEVK